MEERKEKKLSSVYFQFPFGKGKEKKFSFSSAFDSLYCYRSLSLAKNETGGNLPRVSVSMRNWERKKRMKIEWEKKKKSTRRRWCCYICFCVCVCVATTVRKMKRKMYPHTFHQTSPMGLIRVYLIRYIPTLAFFFILLFLSLFLFLFLSLFLFYNLFFLHLFSQYYEEHSVTGDTISYFIWDISSKFMCLSLHFYLMYLCIYTFAIGMLTFML